MSKRKLMVVPIVIGMGLLLFSWYTSYPVSIDSPYDFIYNHISPLYWLSLTMLIALFFIVAINTKNSILKWVLAIGTVLLMYSDSFFFYAIPGSDSHLFRGLTEDFISTGDLSLKPFHLYYKWPLFFVLNRVSTIITSLDLRYLEFVFYCVIGFVFATSIYIYASRNSVNGYVAVIAFFITQRYFLNYQFVPFSLSFSLLFLLFAIDNYTLREHELTLVKLVIFFGITLMHSLVAVLFVAYLAVMYIINRKEKYLKLFLLTLTIYIAVLVFYQAAAFSDLVKELTLLFPQEFAQRAKATLSSGHSVPAPYIAFIAQTFSRTDVIMTAFLTFFGFAIVLIKRKFVTRDYATCVYSCLLSGILYVALGFLLPILGTRAISAVALPASLGAAYLMEGKFKRYFKSIFLILIILFPFILIHLSFYDIEIQFQTEKEYLCANFMIKRYDWQTPSRLLSHIRIRNYLQARSSSEAVMFEDDLRSPNFLEAIKEYDCVVYTVGVGISSLRLNYSTEESLSKFEINHFNQIYDSGDFSYIYLRSP